MPKNDIDPLAIDYSNMSNEKILFIYNKLTGMAPYSHEFVLGGLDPQLLSGFVSAMSSFMGEVTGDEWSRWKTTYGSEHVFLVEGREWFAGALAVSRETNEVRSKLRRIVVEFEDSFECLKEADAIEGKLFIEFDNFVRRVFCDDRLSKRTLIFKRHDWDLQREYERPSIAFQVTKLLCHAKDGLALGRIAEKAKMSIETVKDLAARALWNNAIFMKFVPTDDDILSLSERASSTLLHNENLLNLSPDTIMTVATLDGRTPIYEYLKELEPSHIDTVLVELGDLINRGFIQKISIEKRLVLVNECVMNQLAKDCAIIIGEKAMKDNLLMTRKKGIGKHPWIGRLRITDSMNIHCIMDDTMTPADLDQMFDAIEYIIRSLKAQMEQEISKSEAKAMLEAVRQICHRKWSTYLWDVTV